MALIKSTILAQISGSINGTTFSHNRGGAYARNRSMVSNPATPRQSEVRSALSALSKMWAQSLTQDQRDLWNAFGSAAKVVNRVGDTISLSGIASYNRVNLFRVTTLGQPPLLTPPSGYGDREGETIPAFDFVYAMYDTGPTLQVNFTAPVPADMGLVCYAGPPVSPGIKFYRGPYPSKSVDIGTASTSMDVLLANVSDNTYVPFRLTLYDTNTDLPIWTVYVPPQYFPPAAP